ncbi:MAG: GNAT family N-acetyltransferase [Planctomycetes bacterium]|nr:GNAT family N-acetyltransferase [Planctomycetota bacterium]
MEFPRLETERLYLRELALDDALDVQEQFSDPLVTEHMDIEPCNDLKSAREIVSFHLHDTGVRWGVFSRRPERLIGTCGFHCWDTATARAEIGFDLRREHWGQGLMKEAVIAALRFGFSRMSLASMYADVEPLNARSIGLLLRLGFEHQTHMPHSEGLLVYELSAVRYRLQNSSATQ